MHGVMYDDTQEVDDRKLLAIARGTGQVVDGLIFPSIIAIDHECINQKNKLALCVRSHKPSGEVLGIL